MEPVRFMKKKMFLIAKHGKDLGNAKYQEWLKMFGKSKVEKSKKVSKIATKTQKKSGFFFF
tara:strand:+ start:946 stop:1128 length:183 start_codon:yes stop_codon:yes gene_type:complete